MVSSSSVAAVVFVSVADSRSDCAELRSSPFWPLIFVLPSPVTLFTEGGAQNSVSAHDTRRMLLEVLYALIWHRKCLILYSAVFLLPSIVPR